MTDPIALPVRQEVESRLAAIERTEDVRFLLVVESGSRAWGFPSPDSDYDVRFVYVRQRDWYLRLHAGRDVIEQPIENDIDLNGWDIRKMLGLMLKSNAVTSEWLSSPIRYRNDDPAVARIAALANRCFNPHGYAMHYANVGKNTVAQWFAPDGTIPVKRYFYALRPALSIRALRLNPSQRPPMNMRSLMAASSLEQPLMDQINDLIALKAMTNEADNTIQMPDIERLVLDELDRAGDVPSRAKDATVIEAADALFLDLVDQQSLT